MKNKIAYLDCTGGISGDMFLGALLDLGMPLAFLEKELTGLSVKGFKLVSRKEKRKGISGRRFVVKVDEKKQPQRGLRDIKRIIIKSKLPLAVKEKSIFLFSLLAKAEAKVHGEKPETVHFHETGAIDSIVDIIGAVIGVRYHGFQKLYAAPIRLSKSPAPATLELLRGINVSGMERAKEMITPTGAVLLRGLVTGFGLLPQMRLAGIGCGIGSRDDREIANVLRVIAGVAVTKEQTEGDSIYIVETNIDDMNPQLYELLMERLFQHGALDVFWTPVQGKKQRPAILVTVLCPHQHIEKIIETVFEESTTFGIRYWPVARRVLSREYKSVQSPYGKLRYKIGSYRGQQVTTKPEYEDCKKLAKQKKISIKEIINMV